MNSHNTHLLLLVCQCTSSMNKDVLYLIKDSQGEPPFCSSDHVSVLCYMNHHIRPSEDNMLKPAFRKADYCLINAI